MTSTRRRPRGKQTPARSRGRPPVHEPATLVPILCEEIAAGKLVKVVCKKHGVTPKTLRQWATDNAHFGALYARAREEQAHAMAEECVELAEKAGTDPGDVAQARLEIDTKKWMASKIAPRTYSDRQQVDLGATESLAALIAQAGMIPATRAST